MASLLERIHCSRGIKINSQLVDLFDLLNEDEEKSKQDIDEYISKLRKNEKLDPWQARVVKINKIVSNIKGISLGQKNEIVEYYLECYRNGNINKPEVLKAGLAKLGYEGSINDEVQRGLQNIEFKPVDGITLLNYDKVKQLYNHVVGKIDDKSRYDCITIEKVGKYSSFISVDGVQKTAEKFDKVLEFAEKNNKAVRLNAIISYDAFPAELYEDETTTYIMNDLYKYIEEIAEGYKNRIQTIDMFDELIYDDDETDYIFKEKRKGFHERNKGWQEKLSIEDMCQLACYAKSLMPNVLFCYNESNWENSKKRRKILSVIKKIQSFEKKYHNNYKQNKEPALKPQLHLIDTIGMEEHLSIDTDVFDIRDAVNDVVNKTKLPIEITELEVIGISPNCLDKEVAIGKQNLIFNQVANLTEQNQDRIKSVTIWSQSDELSNTNSKYGRCAYSSLMDKHFNEKDISLFLDKAYDMSGKESLFEKIKKLFLRRKSSKIKLLKSRSDDLPQVFNYHTHMMKSKHSSVKPDEYIINAINVGYRKLGFLEYIPLAKEENNKRFKIEELPEYIRKMNDLKEIYNEKIDLYTGFEFEYYGIDIEKTSVLTELRKYLKDNADYLVLAQKNIPAFDGTEIDYPLVYAQYLIEAMETGLVSYISHPDYFYKYFKEENIAKFEKASEMICEVASQLDIPLEIDLNNIYLAKKEKSELIYPVRAFWQVAQKYKCKVLYGVNAHTPDEILDLDLFKKAKKMLAGLELNFVSEDYVPSNPQNVMDIRDMNNIPWIDEAIL